jgi:hypothetical protein
MTPITEQHLIDLGFERIDVSKEESGDNYDYYYYDFELGQLSLISCDSDENEWYVEIFNCKGFRMCDYELLNQMIDVLKLVHEHSKT